ncbi:MAG: hypothetical protein WCH52_00585 [Bacteroidota bacterium]
MIIDFKIHNNLIVASHITGIYDVNRNNILANDDFSIVADWANSIEALQLQGIIFHNNFSEETCKLHQSDHIYFVKIDYNSLYNPNVFRYFIYEAFLKSYAHLIKNIFFTDISDVVVYKNPFQEKIYLDNHTSIFCGDEREILDNAWMQNHSNHLRSKIPDYALYETNFKNETLLNCGIIGGNISVMHRFIKQLKTIHQKYNSDNDTPYTGDMGAFNYLARSRYHHKIIHGNPVNTEFKNYSNDFSCWFKHK